MADSSASSVSPTAILATLQNIVTAINGQTQASINLAGAQDFYGLTAATVVKASAGRVVRISVIVAGSATGRVYDAAATGVTTNPIYVIPMTVGVVDVNIPTQYGIVVVPGTGQTVSGSFS